jgi:hypothetical protein
MAHLHLYVSAHHVFRRQQAAEASALDTGNRNALRPLQFPRGNYRTINGTAGQVAAMPMAAFGGVGDSASKIGDSMTTYFLAVTCLLIGLQCGCRYSAQQWLTLAKVFVVINLGMILVLAALS